MTNKEQELIITRDDYWTYIQTADYIIPKGWDKHGGKFLVFGNEDQIMFLVQILIANGSINPLKYAPPSVEMGYKTWALMVFCLDSDNERIWHILQHEGVTRKIWKYDRQTIKDWQLGGKLYKRLKR